MRLLRDTQTGQLLAWWDPTPEGKESIDPTPVGSQEIVDIPEIDQETFTRQLEEQAGVAEGEGVGVTYVTPSLSAASRAPGKTVAAGEVLPGFHISVNPPAPPPPPPEVVGAVNALDVVRQIMDATGQTTVTKDVLDTAIQKIQEGAGGG